MRIILISFMACWMTACAAKDEAYYAKHPQALQNLLENCSAHALSEVTCGDLQQLARRMNTYAFDMQTNPRAFGVKILNLQETIARQERQLDQDPNNKILRDSLIENKKQLREQLAIIKWLQSPKA